MKKLLSLICSLSMLLSLFLIPEAAGAKSITSGNYKYKLNDDNTATIIRYANTTGKSEKAISIPSEIDGHKVTKLGEYSFDTITNVTKIFVPDSVVEIKRNAIGNVKRISLGKNVKRIHKNAFYSAQRLTEITVSKSNKNYTSKLGVLYNKAMTKLIAYPDAKQGKNFAIPKTVSVIGSCAFDYNKNLREVTFSKNLKKIDVSAFEYSKMLYKVTIPNTVTTIGDYAFYRCENISALKINANKNLKINKGAFMHCTALEKLTVPKVSGKSVFLGCKGLKSITIPSNVKTLTEDEFFDCVKLKAVTVPKTVKTIKKSSLGYCEDGYCGRTKVEGFTINGAKGSAAEKYAKSNGFKFVVVK